MKAFVLAAGVGTRLRPLTSEIPKPMVPVLGRPALYHTFMNLKKNGFDDICANLHYCPNAVTDYFSNAGLGVKLTFSFEKKLLGTAGAVKKNESFFDGTFVVMSGDGLSDVNLKEALAFHKKNKSAATIVLKKIDTRFEYGITLTDKRGKVKKFVEKPLWGDVFANTVNTGIYILEPEIFKYIPKNKFFDFGADLFPLLLKNKKNIFGYVTRQYWTDIGNIYEYKKGVFDALNGKVKIGISGVKSGQNYISQSAKIDKSVKIHAPCFIGDNAIIGKNSVLAPYCVISNNVIVSDNCEIDKSIIWENSKINKNTKIHNTIVGYAAEIPAAITLFDSIFMEQK
ncbi:MAG: NDP-sugar synthase [Endomicrobium sp.]|jgi:mannose-1-phosphate guanylyltransferase/phosphomannomutase|nr:NDP-sugar synthase [Endomicrobium sp.]